MGTIIVDLERRQTIALLPDDHEDTVATWLAAHPTVEVVCRDRAQVYAHAIQRGAPQAQQVVDRWHLIKNIGEVVQRVADRHPAARRDAVNPPLEPVGKTHVAGEETDARVSAPSAGAPEPPSALSGTERSRSAARRAAQEARFTRVKALATEGHAHRAIAHLVGLDRRTVKKYIQADVFPGSYQRPPVTPSSIWPYADHVRHRHQEGMTMQAIWEELQQRGYTGRYSSVRRFVQRHGGPSTQPGRTAQRRRPLSARRTRSLLLTAQDRVPDDQRAVRERLEAQCGDLADTGTRARERITLIRQQQALNQDS